MPVSHEAGFLMQLTDVTQTDQSVLKTAENLNDFASDLRMKRVGVLTNFQSRRASFKGLGVEALYLFGSRARGEATDLSDVDLFFDYEKGRLGVLS